MAYRQNVKGRNTLIKFAEEKSIYIEGIGTKTELEVIQVPIGLDDDGKEITTDCFYCEWLNNYGSVAIMQQQNNVYQPARIRMTFIPTLYEILQSKNVKIFKNGKKDKLNTFVLNSAIDDYLEQNKMMEFQVKRSDSK